MLIIERGRETEVATLTTGLLTILPRILSAISIVLHTSPMLPIGDPGRTYSQAPDRAEDKEVIKARCTALIEAIAQQRQRDVSGEVCGQKGGGRGGMVDEIIDGRDPTEELLHIPSGVIPTTDQHTL